MIDINSDMGESFGRYTLGQDKKLMPYIDSCNIACGFHAGDPKGIEETIQEAINHGVSIGAHPSFPDLQGFGRRNMNIESSELKSIIKYQVAAIKGLVESWGESLHHVKPHGALYNMATNDYEMSRAIVSAVKEIDNELIIYAPFNSKYAEIVRDEGMDLWYESFADRRYNGDLTLVSRSHPGAVIYDAELAVEQVKSMVEDGKVTTIDGKQVPIKTQTVCIHGDNRNALEIARSLRNFMD